MHERNESTIALPESESKDVLTGILRRGARKLLADAIETEVTEWIAAHATVRDAAGRRQVVRNGQVQQDGGLGDRLLAGHDPKVNQLVMAQRVDRFHESGLPSSVRAAHIEGAADRDAACSNR